MSNGRDSRAFRLKCAKCGGVILCSESIVETGGACADCGQAIVIEAYPPLLKVAEERAAARAAEKQRRDEERRVQREAEERQREEERAHQREEARKQREKENEKSREEARLRKESLQRWEEEQRQKDAERREREEREARVGGLLQATEPVRGVPAYKALETTSTLLDIFGAVYVIVAIALVLVAVNGKDASVTVPCIAGALIAVVVAIVVWGLAQLLRAIRDMAMNSWKQVILLQDVEKQGREGTKGPRDRGAKGPDRGTEGPSDQEGAGGAGAETAAE